VAAILITNPLLKPLRVASLIFDIPQQYLTRLAPPTLPVSVAPGATFDLSYRYAPLQVDTIRGRLLLVSDQPCTDTIVILLRGNSQSAFANIMIPTLTGEVGSVVAIPLVMQNSSNLSITGTYSFRSELLFNRSMLWPLSVTSSSGTASFQKVDEGNNLRTVITVQQSNSPTNGTLAELSCLVLLGNNDVTPLQLSSFTWLNGIASVSTVDGDFTTTGICQAGGKRLVALPGTFKLSPNRPNPFNPTTTLDFLLPADGYTTLVVFDALGRKVATLVQESLSAGMHSAVFNASYLSSGIYIAQLTSGNNTQMIRMTLLR